MDEHTDPKHLRESAYNDAHNLDRRNEIQEQYGSRPVPWFQWVLARLREQLPVDGEARILELGGGSGALWVEALRAGQLPGGWKIVLSDFSPGMVADAQRNLLPLSQAFAFAALDAQSLPFAAESFDALLAVGVLDHLPDIERALAETKRALRPGGVLMASAGGDHHLRELQDLLKPFLPEQTAEQIGGAEERFGLSSGERLLARYFEQVTRSDYHDRLIFREAQPVVDYVLSEAAVEESLDAERLGGFINRVKREQIERGAIEVTVEKGIFVALNPK